jgi:beta-glucanase (GH16 family)
MRLSATAVAFALAFVVAPAVAAPPDRTMRLVFEDNFDRDPASDPGKWLPMLRRDTRIHGDELQIYVDRGYVAPDGTRPGAHPFSVRRGMLSITARPSRDPRFGKPYLSGALTTEGLFEFKYGYAEVRARLPAGAGLWSAFWLMRSGPLEPYGEIDVMENVGQDPGSNFATVHAGAAWASRAMVQVRTPERTGFDRGFHTYGVDWNERSITLYVDGQVTGWMSTPAELKAPMFPILNLAVGGLAGKPGSRTRFPATLEVDYVRVWQLTPRPAPPARPAVAADTPPGERPSSSTGRP